MSEALRLFEQTINNPLFTNTPVYLLFNKHDLFAELIKHKPLNTCKLFSDFEGAMPNGPFVAFANCGALACRAGRRRQGGPRLCRAQVPRDRAHRRAVPRALPRHVGLLPRRTQLALSMHPLIRHDRMSRMPGTTSPTACRSARRRTPSPRLSRAHTCRSCTPPHRVSSHDTSFLRAFFPVPPLYFPTSLYSQFTFPRPDLPVQFCFP